MTFFQQMAPLILVLVAGILNGQQSDFYIGFNTGDGIYVGNNISTSSFAIERSTDLSIMLLFKSHNIGVGIRKNWIKSKVIDKKFIGNIEVVKQGHFGLDVSYWPWYNKKFQFGIIAGGGNVSLSEKGTQTGFSWWLGGASRGRLFEQAYIVLSYKYYRDYFKTNAPSDLSSFYRNGKIHTYSIGIAYRI